MQIEMFPMIGYKLGGFVFDDYPSFIRYEEAIVSPFALKLALTEDVCRCYNRADLHRHRLAL